MAKRRFQTTCRLRMCISLDVAQRARRHDFSTVNSSTRTKIDDVIGAPHRFLIMLDNNQ